MFLSDRINLSVTAFYVVGTVSGVWCSLSIQGNFAPLAIREALEHVTSKDFWEIIDRGRNFEYMPPHQREKLAVFFEWLGVGTPVPKASAAS